MAVGFYITQAIAQSIATTVETALDAGTAAIFTIYDGSVPADADASIGASNILATLLCDATSIASKVDDTPGVLMTFDTITSNTVAMTGTASYFRILTQSAGTVCCQGTVGVGTFDLVLNTVSLTASSNISISSATIFVPEGP
jgi:hypothetical protein